MSRAITEDERVQLITALKAEIKAGTFRCESVEVMEAYVVSFMDKDELRQYAVEKGEDDVELDKIHDECHQVVTEDTLKELIHSVNIGELHYLGKMPEETTLSNHFSDTTKGLLATLLPELTQNVYVNSYYENDGCEPCLRPSTRTKSANKEPARAHDKPIRGSGLFDGHHTAENNECASKEEEQPYQPTN